MLFQRKVDRAQKWLRDLNGIQEEPEEISGEKNLPSMGELKAEGRQEFHLEKGDLPAMLIAAFFTIMPVCLLVLLAISAIVFFL